MKYVLIKAHDWLTHKPSKRALANKRLDEKIVMIFNQHKHRYGSPRITKALLPTQRISESYVGG
ncbi:MAG: hypothetical protein ACX932_05415 [Gammaproteobacteria bacterium]